MPVRGGAREADRGGHGLDRHVGGLQRRQARAHALLEQPAAWRRAGRLRKRRVNVRTLMFHGPRARPGRAARGGVPAPRSSRSRSGRQRVRGHRRLDQLCLTALPMRRDDQPARDGIGDLASVVAAHDVEAEVDPCGAARRREHAARVDESTSALTVISGWRWRARTRSASVSPPRRRRAARWRREESRAADRDQPRAALVGRAGGDHRRRRSPCQPGTTIGRPSQAPRARARRRTRTRRPSRQRPGARPRRSARTTREVESGR